VTRGPDDSTRPPGDESPQMPSIAPAFLWIVAAAIASAFVAIWGIQYVGGQREKALTARVDSLRAEMTRARNVLHGAEADTREARDAIQDDEIEELRHAGLADPVRDLEADLMKHPELIPYPGVEGGHMGFYSADDIRILGGHWVFARFEDGHIGGTILLEYKVDSGRITWKKLAAARD
jgi:hypothetical protein